MRDRQPTPGREGRVKIVGPYGDVVAGTLQMDDDPLDEGTPFNKSTMLKDETAALYGLGTDAVPDDVLRRVLQTIPSTHGVLTVKCSDTEGGTLSKGISVSISPAINGQSVFEINSTGVLSVLVPTNTYTVSLDVGYFYEASGATSQQVAVQQQQVAPLATFSVSKKRSGYLKITESKSVVFPDFIVNGDCWGIGGGGSGGVAYSRDDENAAASGGAGGKTATKMAVTLAGKKLVFNIGAGGKGVTVSGSYEGDGENGQSGGTTSIGIDGLTILNAVGGEGGKQTYGSYTRSADGANGGSGSGCAVVETTLARAGTSGANGNSGASYSGTNVSASGGTGQGTTTRPFGETTYGSYGAAGGSAAYSDYGSRYTDHSTAGDDSASDGVALHVSNSRPDSLNSEDAQSNSGSGSGGVALAANSGCITASGNGADGCAIVRWPAQ